MRAPRAAYPLTWRVMDVLEGFAAIVWPSSFRPGLPYLLLLPAVVLVGLLVLGLVQIGDTSLRTLDTNTFLMSENYTLANYQRVLTEKFFATVAGRSLMGAVIVTAITLLFAFPYAYLMVRTPSSALRRFLLVALFLPFFIGQVVRAYGWLIILGNQGMVNEALGLVGVPPMRLLYNYPAVLFGLVQYMLPFAVLMLAPALTAIPSELEAAAASLGADWVRTFRHIVLPLSRPGLVGAGLVVVTLSLTDFAIPAILGGGTQDFIANAIYDQFFRTSDQGLGATLSLMLVAVGSILVGVVFALFGAGTLAIGGDRK
ncbi:spermidine/putrescine ABC transporter permease protein PotB (plasmid) [Rhizobium gallicum bv. gallicum R602sp]|uniref:Spermidine/putrescine ABC transporter permease protein PotB n=1 Tax=Rhizobium gallicum bv. gallicum R602sp TaxID=1041138 RepID=A0A0B4XCP1_9HYPH|nr:ABC transporter permease [Rhizobium gallicum]AJD44525.1 spermidine/putrescine ABC transporter permease protein PotB [Rhizobium gallicum bv. gallicum R602sp]TDW25020.1 putative spermidine/putrescine transport system permease protein [Rhizobium azibense]